MNITDFIKINLSYFQNLLAISSGLLIFIPNFIEKIAVGYKKDWKSYGATISFIFSVLGSITAQIALSWMTSGTYYNDADLFNKGILYINVSKYVAWIGFISGIILIFLISFTKSKKK